MPINEFKLIDRFFKRSHSATGVVQGIGDDCAIVEVPAGYQLALSIDTMVAGIHFPEHAKPYDIGYKALAVNLSDCAAAGAKPLWATLALTLPKADETWLEEFSAGFFSLADAHRIALIGGDTTLGPLSISVQIHGIVPQGKALLRSNAKVGDDIYVTGNLGDAGLALQTLQGKLPKLEASRQAYIESRLNRPSPRLEIGQALQNIARSCIDISDGLAADLYHVLESSELGAEIELDKLPLSFALTNLDKQQAFDLALYSGDDYELCFTAPPEMKNNIQSISEAVNLPITRIGQITPSHGLFAIDGNKSFAIEAQGYLHFK